MFLATTSLTEYWDKNSEILFLGEWCKRYDNQNDWINLNYKTVPFHWDNIQKKYEDFEYTCELSERFLAQLTEILNSIHGTKLSKRSWRIIAGHWLKTFIEQVFDRYRCIEMARSHFEIHSTWITESKIEDFTPRDIVGLTENQFSVEYNFCMFSEIIKYRKDIPYIEKQKMNRIQKDYSVETSLKNMVKGKIIGGINYIAGKDQKYFLYSTLMPLLDELKLQISLGQFFSKQGMRDAYIRTDNKTDHTLRRQIKLKATNAFEEFLSRIIPMQIPRAYLENYHYLRENSYKVFGNKSKIILTTIGHLDDEFFKVWAADMVEHGSRLYIHQHGGLYGIGRYSGSYEHEVAIADKFFSWGWTDGNKKVVPSPGLRLLKLKTKEKRKTKPNGILWVFSSVCLYSERIYSFPTGPQWLGYINEQISFYNHLDDTVKNRVECRIVHNFGWQERSRLQDNFPDLKFDNGKKQLNKIRKNYSLIVETCNQTTFLESLLINYPTVVFWDTTLWELSEAAKPYITELQNVGIFFSDPIKIAEHINKISLNIDKWWAQPSVQNIRYKFCKQFAFRDDNWRKIWKQILVS